MREYKTIRFCGNIIMREFEINDLQYKYMKRAIPSEMEKIVDKFYHIHSDNDSCRKCEYHIPYGIDNYCIKGGKE